MSECCTDRGGDGEGAVRYGLRLSNEVVRTSSPAEPSSSMKISSKSARTMRFFNRALVAGSAQIASSSRASCWKSSVQVAGPGSVAAACCPIRTSISRTYCRVRFQGTRVPLSPAFLGIRRIALPLGALNHRSYATLLQKPPIS